MDRFSREFEQIGFTGQEKLDLTARLERAAEQNGTGSDPVSHKIHKLSRGMAVGIAAACLMTVGVVATALSPGFQSYFIMDTPGAEEALESGVYRLDRSQTYKGWNVTLAECVGDDNGVYIWVDVTAPEGTVLTKPEEGTIHTKFYLTMPRGMVGSCGGGVEMLPDENPTDNKISFCLDNRPTYHGTMQGERVTVRLDPILDMWWENPGTDQALRHEGELTADIRNHKWVFRNVKLDYPDRTIRLTPNVEIPYAGGTTTLTKVEISPLGTIVRVEGGSCYDHHGFKVWKDAIEEAGLGEDFEGNSITLNRNGAEVIVKKPFTSSQLGWFQCGDALDVQLNMADGTVIVPPEWGSGAYCEDGVDWSWKGEGKTPCVERRFSYMEASNLIPPRAIDPSQVKSVTVCGVEIPVE